MKDKLQKIRENLDNAVSEKSPGDWDEYVYDARALLDTLIAELDSPNLAKIGRAIQKSDDEYTAGLKWRVYAQAAINAIKGTK